MTSVGVLTPTQSGSFDANTSRIYNFPSSHCGPCNNHSSTCNISSQYIFTFWPSEFNLICGTLDFKPQLLIFSGLCDIFFYKLVTVILQDYNTGFVASCLPNPVKNGIM